MYKIINVSLIILLGITMCACTDTKSNRVDEALAKKQKEEEKLKKRINKDKTVDYQINCYNRIYIKLYK